jgi:hypothetical protein
MYNKGWPMMGAKSSNIKSLFGLNQMEPNLADIVIWKRRKKEEILLRTGKGNNDTNDIINYH